MSHGRHLHVFPDTLTAPRTAADAVDAALALIHEAIYEGGDAQRALWMAGTVLEHSTSLTPRRSQ